MLKWVISSYGWCWDLELVDELHIKQCTNPNTKKSNKCVPKCSQFLLVFISDILGNKFLHTLTSTGRIEMRVDIENFQKEKRYAYSTFKVGDAASEYRLTVRGYTGNVGMKHII